MKKEDLVRVFVKGGIISPGDLLKIISVAEKLGADALHLGSRQDILFPVREKNKEMLDETFRAIHTQYEINTFEYQNISSSFVGLDLMPGKKWLASHVYHYVLDSFDYRTRLRINVVDPSQSLVPLFTGNINFLASNQENFWYVYLRFREILPIPWQLPVLVYGEDLSGVAKAIEEMGVVENKLTFQQVYEKLQQGVKMNTQPVTEELVYPDTNFPYYEGINRMPDGKYWLGLYWRDNNFSTRILKAICERCQDTEVGKISFTPWKSFIVKGIFEGDRIGWEKLMGKFGMNLRHSALELNWHLPALDAGALELKNYLVRTLDQQDISTYGLTFTVKPSDDITLFTSIVIEKNLDTTNSPETYNILYSKDFNPNLTEYNYYARDITREVIAPLLIELSHLYYERLDEDIHHKMAQEAPSGAVGKSLYQCKKCLTIYDEDYGDGKFGIAKGTPFKSLPKSYVCPLCGSRKSVFQKVL